MSKLIATYLDRPHVVTYLAWASWLVDVLITWAASGHPLTAATLGHALAAAFLTKRPGDLSRPAVEAKLETARVDAARGARLSSVPPMPAWSEHAGLPPTYIPALDDVPELELPDEATPLERPRGGGMQ